MSFLTYNGVPLGHLRTEYVRCEPVYDDSGTDLLNTHVTIEAVTTFNPAVTASNVVNGRGDFAGLSAVNLRQLLIAPRRPLIYKIGPDNVVVSPAVANGVFMDRDCRNGPKVIDCRVVQIEGDYTFFVYWKAETWITPFSNVLLSNRWSVSCDTDAFGLTTRTVQGKAVIRADAIPFSGASSADDFRSTLFLPVPPAFRRERVRCQVTPDGTQLAYTVVDRETGIALGALTANAGPVVTMSGNATSGSESTVKSIRDQGGLLMKMLNTGFGAFDTQGFFKAAIHSLVPVNKANCLVRVQGRRGTLKKNLAILAANVCLDRFPAALTVSAYCTQGLDSEKTPWVEVRCEFMPTVNALLTGVFNRLAFDQYMNLNNDIVIDPPGVPAMRLTEADPAGTNAPLPGGGGTRGDYIGALAVQVLSPPGQVPAAPPAGVAAKQLNPF